MFHKKDFVDRPHNETNEKTIHISVKNLPPVSRIKIINHCLQNLNGFHNFQLFHFHPFQPLLLLAHSAPNPQPICSEIV